MHYDNRSSPISRPGSTFTAPTGTGYVTSVTGSAQDLQATATQPSIGGVQKSLVAYQNYGTPPAPTQNIFGETTTGLGSLGLNGTTTTIGGPVGTVAIYADGGQVGTSANPVGTSANPVGPATNYAAFNIGSSGQSSTSKTIRNVSLPAAVQQVLGTNGGIIFPTPGDNT
jgi:hypothetical protein